tara:strand:+ start:197 stop:523 length:327 start_codon:yes stop_codon:yes gene_type:complete
MKRLLLMYVLVLLGSCSNDWEATEGVVNLECFVDGEKTDPLFFTIDIDNRKVYSPSYKSNAKLRINAQHWTFIMNGDVNLSINRQSGRMKLSMDTEIFPNHFLFGECN